MEIARGEATEKELDLLINRRDAQRRQEKRLKQEEEAAHACYNKSCWEVNAFDDRIRELGRELRARRTREGG